MGTTDRSLSVLKLFTLDEPVWTVEEIAKELQVSISTAYRYVLALEDVGLITTGSTGKYVLGPAIIKLDRQIQLTDPLLKAARPVMEKVAHYAPDGSVVVLCRWFSDSVLCMHQVHGKGPQPIISYERGRPMPMFRGATSRAILANLPSRRLKQFYLTNAQAAFESGFGDTWEVFRQEMAKVRKAGHAVSYSEIDRGRVGIASALLNEERHAIGSLSYVIPSTVDDASIALLASIIQAAAKEIDSGLRNESPETTTSQAMVA